MISIMTPSSIRTIAYLQTWPAWGLTVSFCEPASLGAAEPGLAGLVMGLSEDGSLCRGLEISIFSGLGRLWRGGGECTSGCRFFAGMGLDGRAVREAAQSGATRDGA